MSAELRGGVQGRGLRVAIVAARFNEFVTQRLVEGARQGLAQQGVSPEETLTVWVPGSFEIPLAAQTLAQSGRWDAVICLGAVIRHETDHYWHIATEVARGIAEVGRQTGVPVIFGILTTDTDQQALERAGGKEGNKGYDAALAALEMATLLRQLKKPD